MNATALPTGGTPYPKYEEMWQHVVAARHVPAERFFARRGQAIIWSANLLHGGDTHKNPNRTRWSQVTHYYFEGCAYHTPMLSGPYTGRIFFREPVDIRTGQVVRNEVSHVATLGRFIEQTAAPSGRLLRAKRALKKLLHK